VICFSSRHYPHVEITKGIELTLEDELGHKADIEHYIRTKLRLRKSQAAESLQTEILEKSSLIFLWVVLVVEILNSEYPGKPIDRMRQRLKDIPPGLAALFDLILSRDEENQGLLRLCLQWILLAGRPLKPQELYCAIQFGLKEEEGYSGRWDPNILDFESLEAFVRHSSKGFAEITRNNSSEVQFIHESVREFLLGKYEKQWSGVQSGNFVGQSHEVLRDCCLSQLVCRDEQIPNLSTMLSMETWPDVQSNFPFLDYSSSYIFEHMQLAFYHGMDQTPFLACFPFRRWEEVSIFLGHHPFCLSADCLSTRGKLGSKRYMIERSPYPMRRFTWSLVDLVSNRLQVLVKDETLDQPLVSWHPQFDKLDPEMQGEDTRPGSYQVRVKIWGPCLCYGMDKRSFFLVVFVRMENGHIAWGCSVGPDIQEPPQLDLTP